MQISISNKAHNSIQDIFECASEISICYANSLLDDIYLSIEMLKDFPYIGRYVPELESKYFRERICKGFRIIYFISEFRNTIYIQYIVRSRQNLSLFFKVHEKEILEFINQIFN